MITNVCATCPRRIPDIVWEPGRRCWCERQIEGGRLTPPSPPPAAWLAFDGGDPASVVAVEPELPSYLTMAGNFAISTASHLVAGAPVVDDTTYEARLAICAECPKFRPSDSRCSLCGCHLRESNGPGKARWADARCPDDPPRWEAVT